MAEYLDIDLPLIEKDENGEYKATRYLEDLLRGIVYSIGGEGVSLTNVISLALQAEKVPQLLALIQSLKKKVENLESSLSTHIVEAAVKQLQIDTATFNTQIKTSDYTAKNKDYIEARNGITLRLPVNPISGDEVTFANGDGTSITYHGNGNKIKYIDKVDMLKSTQSGSSLDFHFFTDNTFNERYWRAK